VVIEAGHLDSVGTTAADFTAESEGVPDSWGYGDVVGCGVPAGALLALDQECFFERLGVPTAKWGK